MPAVPVKAHQIKSVGGAHSSDGKYGLIRFVREKPMDDGTTDVWVALPNALLPYLASTAVKSMPQPKGTTVPNIITAQGLALGVGPGGEVVLSITIDQNATLSFRLETDKASGLLQALQGALKDVKNGGAKPEAAKRSKKPN